MALSTVSYPGTGTTGPFQVPFPYLLKSHVVVTIDDIVQAVDANYTWSSPTTILFTLPVAVGKTIKFARNSSPDGKRIVDHQDAAVLTESTLDADALQLFYLIQEAADFSASVSTVVQATESLFNSGVQTTEVFTAGIAQTTFTLTKPYVVGTNNLNVYVNGIRKRITADYTETSNTVVTFTSGLTAGTVVEFLVVNPLANGASSEVISYIPGGTSSATRNVQTKLREGYISITDKGAIPNTNCTVAIQAACDEAKLVGKKVYIPPGIWYYTALNLDDIDGGLTIEGDVHPYRAAVTGLQRASELRCIATGSGNAISIKSSFGITFKHLYLSYSDSAFTGKLISAGHSARALDTAKLTIDQCKLAGLGGLAIHASALVHLDKVITSSFISTVFMYADVGITTAAASYSNAIMVTGQCTFVLLNGDAITFGNACNAQGWTILCNTFEPRADSTASSISTGAAGATYGMMISGNWFGDAGAARSWIRLTACSGTSITGNYFFTSAPDYAVELASCIGAHIAGNRFDGKALNLTVASPAVVFTGNDCPTGSTAIAWTGTQPSVYQNGGIPDAIAGLRMAGGARHSLFFNPTGAGAGTELYQVGDILTLAREGVANYLSFNMATGAMFPAHPAGASQTVCAIWAGSGVPSNSVGADGHYYFRSDGGAGTHIYHKNSGTWTPFT